MIEFIVIELILLLNLKSLVLAFKPLRSSGWEIIRLLVIHSASTATGALSESFGMAARGNHRNASLGSGILEFKIKILLRVRGSRDKRYSILMNWLGLIVMRKEVFFLFLLSALLI